MESILLTKYAIRYRGGAAGVIHFHYPIMLYSFSPKPMESDCWILSCVIIMFLWNGARERKGDAETLKKQQMTCYWWCISYQSVMFSLSTCCIRTVWVDSDLFFFDRTERTLIQCVMIYTTALAHFCRRWCVCIYLCVCVCVCVHVLITDFRSAHPTQ